MESPHDPLQGIAAVRETQRSQSEQYERLAKRFREGLLSGVNSDQFNELADQWDALNGRLRELERRLEEAGDESVDAPGIL